MTASKITNRGKMIKFPMVQMVQLTQVIEASVILHTPLDGGTYPDRIITCFVLFGNCFVRYNAQQVII